MRKWRPCGSKRGPASRPRKTRARLGYDTPDGGRRALWAFVMLLGYSRAMYVEFVPAITSPAFIECHLNAFNYFGGVPRNCLHDNARVVILDRGRGGQPNWNRQLLDFSNRLGFAPRVCRPYRA